MTHIGKKIEEVVRIKNIPIVEFAKRVNTTRNNLYNIFRRESIDTDLLWKIGEILDYDFFLFLSKETKHRDADFKQELLKDKNAIYTLKSAELKKLEYKIQLVEKENEHLKERIADKDEIITLLKKEVAEKP